MEKNKGNKTRKGGKKEGKNEMLYDQSVFTYEFTVRWKR